MSIPLKSWIVIHVCYREIFKAPVKIDELMEWLGISASSILKFHTALEELKKEALIIEENGLIAREGNQAFISAQPKKAEATREIIKKGTPLLIWLARLPFVKFIGISGSVAAENPTIGKEGWGKGHVDLDLYVVLAKHSLWVFVFFQRILTHTSFLLRNKFFYCFNYITEEDFLEIPNRSFFTATEFINLKPFISNWDKRHVLNKNSWIRDYYPTSVASGECPPKSLSLISIVRWLPNEFFYFLFFFTRSAKRLDFRIFRLMKRTFNSSLRYNYQRVSNPNGGYEQQIADRFEQLRKAHFDSYVSETVRDFLFPNLHSAMEKDPESEKEVIEALFTKYA